MLNRRSVLIGITAAGGLAYWWSRSHPLGTVGYARAEESIRAGVDRIEAKMKQLGLPPPAHSPFAAAGPAGQVDEFNDLKERLLDAMDATDKGGFEAAGVNDEASSLLEELTAAEVRTSRGARATRYNFRFDETARAEYRSLFESCRIRDDKRAIVARNAERILSEPRFTAYKRIESETRVPWYVVGAIHNLEASLNLKAHLHNGDPLSERTHNVPAGRPKVWNPPSDWASSAIDALSYDSLADQRDWSLERMLYRIEYYNGLGSRAHDIHTPYLWSYSQHYEKGKYVSDGVWDGEAVSRQCGAAVLIKMLIEMGKITQPTLWVLPT